MRRFHLVEIGYLDFLNKRDTTYLSDYQRRADLGILQDEAKHLLGIYNGLNRLSTYDFNYDILKKIILYRYDGRKIYPFIF
jgi:hypothetical protein